MGNRKTAIAALALVSLVLAGCGTNKTSTSTQTSFSSIAITGATGTIAKGLTVQLTATGTVTGGTSQNITDAASWSSSNPAVITVSATGLVTAVSIGSATIGVLDGSVNQTLTMTVTPAIVSSIAITGSSSSLPVGLTLQLTATATYSDGTVSNLTTATWQSSNSAVATVTGGLVTAVTTGPVTIKATDSATNVSGTFQLTVTPPTLQSIAVTAASSSIYTGQTLQLTATGTLSDSSTTVLTSTATWNSLSPAVATVSAGLVTGVAPGTAGITASSGGITSAPFTVTVAAAGAILIAPTQPQLQLGSTLQVSASNNTGDITNQVAWTTSDPTTLTVVSGGPLGGLITARKVGSATLTATLGSNHTPVTVTVTAAPTSRFAITANPGDSTLSLYTVNNTSGSLAFYTYSLLPGTLVDPVNVLVGPTGEFAYVAVQGGVGALAITTVAGTSTPIGTLTPLSGGFYATANAPTGMSLDPSGTHLYVTDGNQIFAFGVNSTSGALTAVNGSPFTNAGSSNFVAVEPLGRYLYSTIGSTGQIAAFAINSDGSLQALTHPVFVSGQTPQGIAFDASGLYLYVANSGDGTIGSYTIAPGTGDLTLVNAPTVGTQPVALAVSPEGQVYFIDAAAKTVGSASVNLGTGEMTPDANTQATAASGAGIVFNPAFNFIYAVEPAATSEAETFSLNSNGDPLWSSATATRAQGAALAFVPGNQTAYGAEYIYSLVFNQGNVEYTIDLTNGTLSDQTNVDGGR